MEIKEIESILEGILFAAGDPMDEGRLCTLLSMERREIEPILRQMADEYRFQRRGFRLVRMESRWQLISAPEHADIIRRALEERRAAPLSKSALEVLAVVAYYQPVTRVYIEQLRGVDSSYTVVSLTEKGLIEDCGRLEVPGRPIQYRTTPIFLRSFGLTSLEELPALPFGLPGEGEQLNLFAKYEADGVVGE
jgi:segregation and condensation protein B